jgi:hypothetical protein
VYLGEISLTSRRLTENRSEIEFLLVGSGCGTTSLGGGGNRKEGKLVDSRKEPNDSRSSLYVQNGGAGALTILMHKVFYEVKPTHLQ